MTVAARPEFGTGLRAWLDPNRGSQPPADGQAAAPLVELLPLRTAYLFRALPIGLADGRPVVAISDPMDELGMACVRQALGTDVEFVEADEPEILAGLARAYGDEDF
jgi:type II secretion system (T2SS) protein E